MQPTVTFQSKFNPGLAQVKILVVVSRNICLTTHTNTKDKSIEIHSNEIVRCSTDN